MDIRTTQLQQTRVKTWHERNTSGEGEEWGGMWDSLIQEMFGGLNTELGHNSGEESVKITTRKIFQDSKRKVCGCISWDSIWKERVKV